MENYRATVLPLIAFVAVSGSLASAQTTVSQPVAPYVFTGDLSKLPPAASAHAQAPLQRRNPASPALPPRLPGPPDPLWQKTAGPSGPSKLGPSLPVAQFTTPFPNFDTNQPGDGPPDANGAVGPNHYIAMVNFTYQIFDKSGVSKAGPTDPASLWSGAPQGDPCKTQRGDPYVVYDHLADRWVMSFFANDPTLITQNNPDPLQYECIAVSKTSDPVAGGWFAYTFHLPQSNDYPKLAVWPDGYYMISQRGYDGTNQLDAWVFDRSSMLTGSAATFQHPSGFPSEHDVIALPSDLTGPPPPAGSPNFYARPYDGTLYSDGSPRIEIFEFHTDWGNPANTTFSLKQTITPATFRSDICAGGGLDQFCIPQPGSSSQLDALSIWPMGPLQYRNFGNHETLVFSHAVNVDGNGLAGIRWHELRRSPVGSGSWTLYQEGTFEPADSLNLNAPTTIRRWTSSLAMDQAGNMAMGYNVSNDGSNGNVYPGVRVVGRLASDTPGEMTTGEVTLANGGSSLTCKDKNNNVVGCRWGDYAAMRVDPADGCTFWYTTEYEPAGGQQTRVSALRFPSCNPANLAISKTAPTTAIAGTQITYSILVTNNGPSTATNVIVKDTLPANVVFLTTTASCTSGSVTTGCNIGNLASGASYSFTIQVKISAGIVGSSGTVNITNTATVSSDQLDPDTTDNTASATTNVTASADLSLAKVCKPDPGTAAQAGQTAYCVITVTNNGPSDARSVEVVDNIVANTPFVIGTVTPSPAASCTATPGSVSTGTVDCTLSSPLIAGGIFTLTVNFSAQNGGNINDTATVTTATPDPNAGNNSATGAVTYVSVANLSVTKTAAGSVTAGTNLTYTISVSNAGPSTATNVVVKDTLPGQISVVSVTPSAGSCTAGIPGNAAQPLTCTLGSLNNGGSASISVVVKVNPSTPDGSILTNNATVASDAIDSNNSNNSSTAYTNVVARADLAIVKTSDQASYKPTSVITYTITVTNNGPSDAQAVIVTDNLPQLKQAIYQSDTGGCTKSGSNLTCNLGTMATGASKSFNVYMLVKGNQGSVSNTASVNSSTTDPTSGNNTSIRTVAIK